jgi:hypothetical protein
MIVIAKADSKEYICKISQCKATVEMSLEQIVGIEKTFTRVQELEEEMSNTKLQLAESKEDLRIVCKSLYVSHDKTAVWVDNFSKLTQEEQEALIFSIKRNQNV